MFGRFNFDEFASDVIDDDKGGVFTARYFVVKFGEVLKVVRGVEDVTGFEIFESIFGFVVRNEHSNPPILCVFFV